jgi:hypothetical protein
VTVGTQIYDTNFVFLWEGASLVHGDRPYRDFYEWGAPLAAYVSAAAQLLVGYRLIGEFLVQWGFIVAGVTLAFSLGLRLSRSIGAMAAVLPMTLVIVAYTPTYHYSKIFFFPLTIWIAWRYMERPDPGWAAIFGVIAAVAFLFRHDYGVYIAFASVASLVLARIIRPDSRSWASIMGDSFVYGAMVLAVLAPWLIAVQVNEGLIEYVRLRGQLYDLHQNGLFYASLLRLDPIATLNSWFRAADSTASANGALWLEQMALLLPLVMLVVVVVDLLRHRFRLREIRLDAWRMVLAASFLAVVNSFLLRDSSYVVTVAPLIAALSARFLIAGNAAEARLNEWAEVDQGRVHAGLRVARAIAVAILLMSTAAALEWTRNSPILQPSELLARLRVAAGQLFSSPPVRATMPLDGNPALSLEYLHDCTASGDRLLITGSTPFQVAYYADRSIAGGHQYWHHGWRSDPAHEQQSLKLLQEQSVPFAFSTTDPVLDDFKAYPNIRKYLSSNYFELPGSKGRVLVDRRRMPTGSFRSSGFPCFR